MVKCLLPMNLGCQGEEKEEEPNRVPLKKEGIFLSSDLDPSPPPRPVVEKKVKRRGGEGGNSGRNLKCDYATLGEAVRKGKKEKEPASLGGYLRTETPYLLSCT